MSRLLSSTFVWSSPTGPFFIARQPFPILKYLTQKDSIDKQRKERQREEPRLFLPVGEETMARLQLIAVALIFSSCLILPLTSARSAKVSYCDKHSEYDVKVSGVEITPYPVRGGKPATFSIAASADKPISGGKLVIDVFYIGLHVRTETHDICSETSCPISAGDFIISHSQDLPGFTPPGNYRLKMRMEDDNNQELTCISFNFSIAWVTDSVAES